MGQSSNAIAAVLVSQSVPSLLYNTCVKPETLCYKYTSWTDAEYLSLFPIDVMWTVVVNRTPEESWARYDEV